VEIQTAECSQCGIKTAVNACAVCRELTVLTPTLLVGRLLYVRSTVIHANHGLGASALSWELVMSPLARKLNATFLAHDAPGTGELSFPSIALENSSLYGIYVPRRGGSVGGQSVRVLPSL
jgi:hypothetical protein